MLADRGNVDLDFQRHEAARHVEGDRAEGQDLGRLADRDVARIGHLLAPASWNRSSQATPSSSTSR
ncbi:hypothetical protein [Plantactinospora sp. KLBMP9567]|uniref:hypothetical protein n=1 Tax=Plantactinospora sp. KLBMP9567 TaxID=3085900 RepID=UPI00298249B1|nr:hypothetical protein [Plantactinospora sp. KLBMP9567]MDW5323215.1 hypothetical protein [Plantactinospora sp. KLBMP9567]